MGVCEAEETQNWLQKNNPPSNKIFLDFPEHFGNHDLVIALRTMALTTVRASRVVAVRQLRVADRQPRECQTRAAIEFGS
jgi:hypothetical protein